MRLVTHGNGQLRLPVCPLRPMPSSRSPAPGARFPAPVYAKWGEAAKAAIGIELNYQAIGSGGGQNQITNRTVDFGASDAPMDPDEAAIRRPAAIPHGHGRRRAHREPPWTSRWTS